MVHLSQSSSSTSRANFIPPNLTLSPLKQLVPRLQVMSPIKIYSLVYAGQNFFNFSDVSTSFFLGFSALWNSISYHNTISQSMSLGNLGWRDLQEGKRFCRDRILAPWIFIHSFTQILISCLLGVRHCSACSGNLREQNRQKSPTLTELRVLQKLSLS